eukprot:SAG11_NODE_9333_length_921_cov_1.536496_1_plen_180_part_10
MPMCAQAGGATLGTVCSCSLMALICTATAFCPPPPAPPPAAAADDSDEAAAAACGAALTWLSRLSFFWYPTVGVVVTVGVGWLASMPPGDGSHEQRVSHLVADWCGGTAAAAGSAVANGKHVPLTATTFQAMGGTAHEEEEEEEGEEEEEEEEEGGGGGVGVLADGERPRLCSRRTAAAG